MFRIEMLPAAHGDCLWIEYGKGAEIRRILIDGGPGHTYPYLRERILHLPADQRVFELLIVTHIDADHIEGVVRLLQDAEALNCSFRRIWFNGRGQLDRVEQLNNAPPENDTLGALQGEYLSMLIKDYENRTGTTVWNTDFDHRVAAIDPAKHALPRKLLPGDCALTLLSPTHKRLLELLGDWDDELEKAGLESGDEDSLRERLEDSRALQPEGDVLGVEDEDEAEAIAELPDPLQRGLLVKPKDADVLGAGEAGADGKFGQDGSLANGSSIAVLLQYPADDPEVTFLLAGDAWAPVLESSITQHLQSDSKRLRLTGFKIPHHGSVSNITESLLQRIRCKHFLVSTSGAKFGHPHSRAMELILEHRSGNTKPRLHFNYLTLTTESWCQEKDQKQRRYQAFYPKGISLEL